MWIRAGKQTAVGAEVLDWYGLPSKTPEVDETEAEAPKGSEVRYALGSEPTLVERGMVSPYGTVPAGVHTLMIHVANHSRHHQVLQKGARLGDIEGRVDLAPQQDSGRLLPKCYRDAIKKRRSVDALTPATDIGRADFHRARSLSGALVDAGLGRAERELPPQSNRVKEYLNEGVSRRQGKARNSHSGEMHRWIVDKGLGS